jgi:hypothetical protein
MKKILIMTVFVAMVALASISYAHEGEKITATKANAPAAEGVKAEPAAQAPADMEADTAEGTDVPESGAGSDSASGCGM